MLWLVAQRTKNARHRRRRLGADVHARRRRCSRCATRRCAGWRAGRDRRRVEHAARRLPDRARRRDRPRGGPLRRPARAVGAARRARFFVFFQAQAALTASSRSRSWCRSSPPPHGGVAPLARPRDLGARRSSARRSPTRSSRGSSAIRRPRQGLRRRAVGLVAAPQLLLRVVRVDRATRCTGSRSGRGALIALVPQAIILRLDLRRHRHSTDGEAGAAQRRATRIARISSACRSSFRCRRSARATTCTDPDNSPFYTGSTPALSEPCCRLAAMIKVHVADGRDEIVPGLRARAGPREERPGLRRLVRHRGATPRRGRSSTASRSAGSRRATSRRPGPQAHARRRARRLAPRDQGPALARRVRERMRLYVRPSSTARRS